MLWLVFISSTSTPTTLLLTHSTAAAAAAAKSLRLCPTLCDPIDGSPLGSSVPWILQARILQWVAISFSNAWKWKVKVKLLSHAQLFSTPWTPAYQAPPSIRFSRQEYWSGLPLPSPTLSTTTTITCKQSLKHTEHASSSDFALADLFTWDILPPDALFTACHHAVSAHAPPYYRALYTTKNNHDNTTSSSVPAYIHSLPYLPCFNF